MKFGVFSKLLLLLLVILCVLNACQLSELINPFSTATSTTTITNKPSATTQPTTTTKPTTTTPTTSTTSSTTTTTKPTTSTTRPDDPIEDPITEFDFATMVPAYSKEIAPDGYVVINNHIPFFTEDEINDECIEIYGDLDSLGRCTYAYAILGKDLLPDEENKGDIDSVKPTGWHSVTYPETGNQSLYNRSHLIAWSLAGENANRQNLITGTEYMNQHTMQIFETQLLNYVRGNDTHVAYRVTPIFEGNNLVASGVLMEAYSVEDAGEDIQFCVYLYNIQEGIIIDYATGESRQENPSEDVSRPNFEGTFYDFSKFEGTGTKTQYVATRNSSDGWIANNARIDKQSWISDDVPQIILNGNKNSAGKLTSATISGEISEFYIQYGLSFSDSKIKFTVDIVQNGKVVATKTVTNTSAEQSKGYELHWMLDDTVEGDFVIIITNNSPSNLGSNKDRLSIWNLGWK